LVSDLPGKLPLGRASGGPLQGAQQLDDQDEHVWKGEIFAMVQSFISACSILPLRFDFLNRLKGVFSALLLVLPAIAMQASAQTTTISGAVYDPKTLATASITITAAAGPLSHSVTANLTVQ